MAASVGSRSARRLCLPGFAGAAQLDSRTSVVSVTGEIDLSTVSSLEHQLLGVAEDRTGEVIVDLTGCSFLDSRGLTALVAAKARLERSNRELALVLSNASVLKIFQITGFDKLFAIYPSLGAAVDGTANGNGHG